MKNLLVASTALVATAGMAAADISFTGYARAGVVHEDSDNYLHQRLRMDITAKTETTSGVAVFGAVRLQADSDKDNAAKGQPLSSGKFGLSYGGFSMEIGNTEDVLFQQKAFKYQGTMMGVSGVLSRRHAFNAGFDRSDMRQTGNFDQQQINVVYSNSGITGTASHALESSTNAAYTQAGLGYNFGNGTVGAGYGDSDEKGEYWVLSADMRVGDYAFGGIVGESDSLDDTAFGLSAEYFMSSGTRLIAVYTGGGLDKNEDGYGVGFIHSLGGGVTLRGAVAQEANEEGSTKADFGIRFDF